MFLLVLAAYALLGIYEFVPLYKQKLWKEFFINMVLGIISLSIGLLLSFGIPIPSPVYPLRRLLKSIFGK